MRNVGSPMRMALACLGAALLLAACGGARAAGASSPVPSESAAPSATSTFPPAQTYPPPADGAPVSDYLPGLPAQIRLPQAEGPAPLIILVPGGGWATADPTYLEPLAGILTRDGATTSLITYSTTHTGSTFPTAADEVACAVRWSVQQVTDAGHPPTHVIVLGHSAGGQLAALVAYSGDEFGADCPYDPVTINGLIGIAGIYNTSEFVSGMSLWMGASPSEDPDRWRRADPLAWLQDGSRVPEGFRTLLIHADGDGNVPLAQTTELADALRAKGMDISATVFPGGDHMAVVEAGIAEPPIKAWMAGWS